MTSLQSEDCQSNDLNDTFPTSIGPLRFPLDSSVQIMFTGYYNGFNVEVRSTEEMRLLYRMGCFGKGSASRSKPTAAHREKDVKIMRKRQFSKRNYWYKKFGGNIYNTEMDMFLKEVEELTSQIISDGNKIINKDVVDLVSSDDNDNSNMEGSEYNDTFQSFDNQDIVVVVPDSDIEEDNYFNKLKPKCCVNKVKLKEKLMLTLEEAFFLQYGLGCLQIINKDNSILNIEQSWSLFTNVDKYFLTRYVVYHYFRSKGYVVKPGIKFGGDYLLYKDGPEITHANYIVSIKKGDSIRVNDTLFVLGQVRMAQTTLKEIIFAEVIHPKQPVQMPEGLREYSVREVLITRNTPVSNKCNDEDIR